MGLISMSTTPSSATQARAARRQRWLRSHGCNELLQEVDSGRLAFRTALRVARLSPAQQLRELAKRKGRVQAQELAADTINQFLTRGEGHAIALEILYDAITERIARRGGEKESES